LRAVEGVLCWGRGLAGIAFIHGPEGPAVADRRGVSGPPLQFVGRTRAIMSVRLARPRWKFAAEPLLKNHFGRLS